VWTARHKLLLLLMLPTLVAFLLIGRFSDLRGESDASTVPAAVKADAAEKAIAAQSSVENHRITIRRPVPVPMIDSGKKDFHGKPVMVACSTCHETLEPNAKIRSGKQLTEFHQGLTMGHADLTCLSCHRRDNYDQLTLADGSGIVYSEVMQLCGQCHGPQLRDYQNGSHGGMTGYWDLKKGPRQRNNCIACHDAHAPKFPKLTPVFPPRDRFPARTTSH